MPQKPTDGSLAFFDEQIEALKTHTPAALEGFDPKGIHQARVATRRLKAGLELLHELVGKAAKPLDRAGKKLRRRLGPLRDLDVMIDSLQSYHAPLRLQPALDWTARQLIVARDQARERDKSKGKPAAKMLEPFDAWWTLRHELEGTHDAVRSMLSTKLHEGYDAFAEVAGWVCGTTDVPADKQPVDVHELRIDGKLLRYTLEIAHAAGVRIPKSVFKTFKSMQESLGAWHDDVVLAEETMRRALETELPLHDPELAGLVMDLAKRFLKDSIRELNRFKAQWKRSGEKIGRTLRQRVPLSRDVSDRIEALKPKVDALAEQINELQTDLDPPPTPRSESQAPVSTDVPQDAKA